MNKDKEKQREREMIIRKFRRQHCYSDTKSNENCQILQVIRMTFEQSNRTFWFAIQQIERPVFHLNFIRFFFTSYHQVRSTASIN